MRGDLPWHALCLFVALVTTSITVRGCHLPLAMDPWPVRDVVESVGP